MSGSWIRLVMLVFGAGLAGARQDQLSCGTYPDRWKEELHLHRKVREARAKAGLAAQPAPAGRDVGNIAVLEDVGGIVARRNDFNLDRKTILFRPSAGRYRFDLREGGYEDAVAASSAPVRNLGDDDTREFVLPFSFPYYGTSYRSVWVNSDGNLTFTAGDGSSNERSLGRLFSGLPRIAGLFSDLDPSREPDSVRVLSEPSRFVVSWAGVPEYRSVGRGPLRTLQIRLFPDGRIEFSYGVVGLPDAVVGISPGRLLGSPSLVSFANGSSVEYAGAIAERFGSAQEVDIVTTAQRFYATHEDAYDYLVIFNTLDIAASPGAVAFEVTVRNDRSGYGDTKVDVGQEFGSRRRLQAVLNMGPLSQYPADPNALVPARALSRDTPLSILGHEAGHLFLAFASVRDPGAASARPMLGRQSAHWSFYFNSEASLLEGNRIRDNGPGTSPRFTTVATVEGYSPLDQYLMGLREPAEVPPMFLVTEPSIGLINRSPQPGVNFNGGRRDIDISEVIEAEGRRTPDSTVAQRRFRFAFVLIVAAGSQPTAAELHQVETYRREFELYFRRVTGERAWADTQLRRALQFSLAPAAGVVAGSTANATLFLDRPADSALMIWLRTTTGAASVPDSVTIPAGASSVTFPVRGLRGGVEELSAEPGDTRYETAWARVQVAETARLLLLRVVQGDLQTAVPGSPLPEPIRMRVTDINELPYPGVRIAASVTAPGSVEPAVAPADEQGFVAFRWTPGTAIQNELVARAENSPEPSVTVTALSRPVIAAGGVVNAASFQPRIAPGSIATVFGANLAGAGTPRVTIGGREAAIIFRSQRQLNLVLPGALAPGAADLTVTTSVGASAPARVTLDPLAPGLFALANNEGAVLVAGTGLTTFQRPARRGEALEIFCTGLGAVRPSSIPFLEETVSPPRVFIGARPAQVLFSGLAPGFAGLYQINVMVPEDAAGGTQPLVVELEGQRSNEVVVRLQ